MDGWAKLRFFPYFCFQYIFSLFVLISGHFRCGSRRFDCKLLVFLALWDRLSTGYIYLHAVFLSCDWMEFHGASAGKLTHVGIWIPWWPFVCSTGGQGFPFLTIGQCQRFKWECQSASYSIHNFCSFSCKLHVRLYLSLICKMKGRLGNQVSNTFHGPDSRSHLFG